jgi:glucosamine 6-phosphate synthetase-like amidotransferase/phosphosugar isomerase protein
MCGITGCIVKNNSWYATKIYYNLLRESDIRGQDGTGVTILRDSNFIINRFEGRAKNIDKDVFTPLRDGDCVIGQNRYKVFGLDKSNNQPLVTNYFALVHNGVLYDYEKQYERLIEEYKKRRKILERKLKVDTELILRLIEADSSYYYSNNISNTMRRFEGEAACLLLCNLNYFPRFIAFMKNKILYKGEDGFGNIYFFSTLYIKNKVPEICKNIEEFKNYDVKIY